jgi:hypothetical protein
MRELDPHAGARAAGLRSGWVRRGQARWSEVFTALDVVGEDLPGVSGCCAADHRRCRGRFVLLGGAPGTVDMPGAPP